MCASEPRVTKETQPSLGLSHIMEGAGTGAEAKPASGTPQPLRMRGKGGRKGRESADLGSIYSAVSILSLSQRGKSQGQLPSGPRSCSGNKNRALTAGEAAIPPPQRAHGCCTAPLQLPHRSFRHYFPPPPAFISHSSPFRKSVAMGNFPFEGLRSVPRSQRHAGHGPRCKEPRWPHPRS